MHFDRAYDPEWVQDNVLSELTPLPLAWDRTSLSQPAPTVDDGHLPDTTEARRGGGLKVPRRRGEENCRLVVFAAVARGGRPVQAPELHHEHG